VLPKLAYLTLCRSIQLLARLARGDAAKDLELMELRHQLSVLTLPSGTAQTQARRPRSPGRDQPRAAPIPLVLLPRHARDAAALAPPSRRQRVDLSSSRARAAAAGRRYPAADRPLGQRESPLGVSAYPRRGAATAGHLPAPELEQRQDGLVERRLGRQVDLHGARGHGGSHPSPLHTSGGSLPNQPPSNDLATSPWQHRVAQPGHAMAVTVDRPPSSTTFRRAPRAP
jgi:hypothetical protein